MLIVAATYDVARFSITTNVDALISRDLPWHRRQLAFNETFPQKGILVVVSATTPENATLAAEALVQQISKRPDLFRSVAQTNGEFFERNGFLFESIADVEKSIGGLKQAQPLLSKLAGDPTLRGAAGALSFGAHGVQGGELKLDQLAWPLSLVDTALSDILGGKPASFSWQELLQRHKTSASDLRRFIEVDPVLDFSALQPGAKASSGIQQAASELDLAGRYHAKVGLTGEVALNDDQFSVIRQSAVRDTLTAVFGTLIVLWFALRSWKIIASVFFSLAVGLAITAAFGLMVVGAFNLISIAFFVLFVGLGVDFGIQFSVRYRSERYKDDHLHGALLGAARKVAGPLALAASATAVGFFSFIPTDYNGLSELGLIAGCGMLIAFLCSITLVPSMLAILNPPGESAPIGFRRLASLDDYLQRHRVGIIAGTIGIVLVATPLLLLLQFDFNPIDLQNPNAPSVVTYRELQHSPQTGGNDAEILAPSLGQANDLAKDLASIPEVSRTLTLSSFIPVEQPQKLATIAAVSKDLNAALNPARQEPPPTDQDTVAALRATAATLLTISDKATGPNDDLARHVSQLLTDLAQRDAATRKRAEAVFDSPLVHDLSLLGKMLDAKEITLKSLPADLVRDWLAPDGRARVQLLPKGDLSDTKVLRKFARSVLASYPAATGPAISYFESGNLITGAFIKATLLALASITVLLVLALRRIGDVLLTLVPLLLAGAVTLEISAAIGLVLNFANIIAVPLLLGVGVAFKIYYILAWRAGKTGLLQSSLTRAIVSSAMTNAIAFGSMWMSSYPGMSSMGKLMALSLVCTMAAAVLFQPVLMGRPRQREVNLPQPGELPLPAESSIRAMREYL
ncbi:hopanoid biosynthesis-associated RND transporter HpnN [Bradyrhizobium centrolobii]|uniref:Hopanoid biosynthesis-associated RND transporter HpnN n=1 Tax=Bradyrhizobium centrolobii TaxID=1505087 RepID=A0A176Z1P2_9BRAD|nr:hopanoid biosynthesis-associated RND transporter HpnN [Bradyrhizobium centrolobii]